MSYPVPTDTRCILCSRCRKTINNYYCHTMKEVIRNGHKTCPWYSPTKKDSHEREL